MKADFMPKQKTIGKGEERLSIARCKEKVIKPFPNKPEVI